MIFWLGTHRPSWLAHAGVPLMVSARTLRGRRTLPRAVAPWVLDSGGFTELSLHGQWTITAAQYAQEIDRCDEVGLLEWAAPQDWMCEPWISQKTGLTVQEHQERTICSVLELRTRVRTAVIPVLQGWSSEDYWRHVEDYERAGIDLRAEPVVGLGSICRRQGTAFAARLVEGLARYGIRLHGFGIKSGAAARWLSSADSLAWSFHARRQKLRLASCAGHQNCANCLPYALQWRAQRVQQLSGESGLGQLDLFAMPLGQEVRA